MEIYVEGQKVQELPQLTLEEKLHKAIVNLSKFWNTPLRGFWKNVYIRYRDEYYGRKKAGNHAATHNPADNGNHDDGKPAA